MLALKTDNTMWAWGRGYFGAIGNNTNGNSACLSSPVQIPGTTWCRVCGTSNQSSAMKTDGTLWTWGSNYTGFGLRNTDTYASSPVQVPGTTWCSFSISNIGVGLKTDGTLWVAGVNGAGGLGNNKATGDMSSPIQVPGTTWCKAKTAAQYVLALKTDNTLWAWGLNEGGLGLNDNINRSSPVQVPGAWCDVLAGNHFSQALKTDGTLWTLGGSGTYGRLGLNCTACNSSPVQIPGTWTKVQSGNPRYTTGAFRNV